MKYKHIIIDATNLFFKAYHSQAEIFEKIELSKNTIFTILQKCFKYLDFINDKFAYEDSQIYFLFDNSQSGIKYRKLVYSEYKSKRDKKNNPKNLFHICKIFTEILKVYSDNYFVLFAENHEADDLTKPLIAKLNIDQFNQACVISEDLDWSRNITDTVHWYNWNSLFNKEEFYSKYEFFPTASKICFYKSFLGDASDSIPAAISKIDNKILLYILDNFESMDDLFANMHKHKEQLENWYGEIQNSALELRRNYALVRFFDLENIDEHIQKAKQNITYCKILLSSYNIPIPNNFLSNSEIEEGFFK